MQGLVQQIPDLVAAYVVYTIPPGHSKAQGSMPLTFKTQRLHKHAYDHAHSTIIVVVPYWSASRA